MRKILLFLGILILTLGLCVGAGSATLHTIIDDNSIIYEDEAGVDILVIDHNVGVTIANYTTGNTYTSMNVTSTTDASSLTVGSVVTAGGIACAKQLFLGDDLDMTVSASGTYEITLKDAAADALSVTREGTNIILFDTDTPEVTITPATTITGLLTSGGGITVGTDGAGFDVTFYGDNSGSDFIWDQDGDTDASLTLGTTGGTKGVDFKVYGEANGTFLHWDRSVDDLLLGGAVTRLIISGTVDTSLTDASIVTSGSIACTKQLWLGDDIDMTTNASGTYDITLKDAQNDALTILGGGTEMVLYCTNTDLITYTSPLKYLDVVTFSPTAIGTKIDFELETEWVSGTLINADFGSATTLTGAAVGIALDFSGVHADSDQDIKAIDLTFPDLALANVSKTIKGVEISGDTLTQTTGGSSTWTGVDVTIPTLVETGGTLTGYGVKITGGTLTTDPVSYGVHMSGNHTTGIALAGSYSAAGIAISGTCTEYAISIGGTYDHGIYFTEDPAAADVTNSFINIGNYTTGIAVAPTTANMFGVMHNVTLAVNVAYWYQAYYTKITTSGTTTTTSIAGHAIRMQVASNLASSYGIQCHTNVSAGADATGEIISVSAYVGLGTGETTSDRVVALQAMISGSGTAGTVVGDAIVGYFVNAGTVVTTDDIIKVYNQSAATVVDGIEIENDGTMTNAIKINNDLTCSVGILFEGTHTIGLDLNGAYTTAGISMDGATFAALDNEIEMRNTVTGDKTIIASGSAADDNAIRAAVGADADIADGSLYLQIVDGAGALYIKKDDVWTAFSNP